MELGARCGTWVGDASVMSGVDRVDFFKNQSSHLKSKFKISKIKIEVSSRLK